jgi:polar amino acid transport system substrate-binding protein
VVGPAEITATSMADLAGRSIAVVRGAMQDTDITAQAPEGTTIRRYEDDATAAAAIAAGQVDFIATAAAVGKALAEQNPDRHLENKFVFRVSPYSIGVRLEDHDLLQWLNTALYYHRLNGDLAALHAKWLGGEMPELPVF